ncbi:MULTISPECIES: hypothetical protein [unclassified Bradyrhizobium]|uniref:hypothetical protein n=1 Tax=unclassified Bradyrhizobium TaxID=2631580 RepID=UPI002479D539|nr:MULTISPECIES: hypothetical protein [unclassified Bradyrhizobium]WGR71881.1 hypothetical protein MTX24_02640 [Bradyrhizobium sp. ISRA426]WGR76715.1 hypothetical protein MTX21_27590 [Bradyrhizobium sp. ISRA430]WGR87120.1 hypothetical protein MTX25_02640 [Bradyrhizobium sp. ISRA432]
MSDEDLLRHDRQKPISSAEDIVPDESFELLSRQLCEGASFSDDESPSNDVFLLLEENARLRALAISLSGLVGDLSEREWSNALASADRATLNRLRSSRA